MSRIGARSLASPPQPASAVPATISSMQAGWRHGCSARKHIFQRHADEYGHAEIVIIEEGAKAAVTIARAYQPQLIEEEHRPGTETGVVPIAHVDCAADEIQGQQGHDLQHRNNMAVRIA